MLLISIFNDAFSITDLVLLGDRTDSEYWAGNDVEWRGDVLLRVTVAEFAYEYLGKTHKAYWIVGVQAGNVTRRAEAILLGMITYRA
jgi:hypothetical protein